MTPADIATMTRAMGPVVREFTAKAVTDAVAQLLERNAALALRILELETHPAPVAVGPVGPIGQKGDAGAGIASLVVSAEGRLLAHLTDGRSLDAGPVPSGRKGDTGDRGEAGLIGPVGPSGPAGERGDKGESGLGLTGAQGERGLPGQPGERGQDAPLPDGDAIVMRVLALVPQPERGEKGDPGEHGKDGAAGLDGRSVTLEDLGPLIAREIETRIAVLPVAKDGVGFTGAVVTREGHLVLTLSNGTTQDIGTVIGKDGSPGLDGKDAVGTPGIDGKDGLGFDNYDLYLDETRGWIFRLEQGDRCKEWELGIPFDAKVYQAGLVYPKGAGVTWDGNYWICLAQTSDQPGEGCPAWRLAVRRGKQGREGKQGKDGSAGRDLTQMDPATGRKW